MMNTRTKSVRLVLLLLAVLVFDPGVVFGQAHFPYRPRNRGQYSEGQRGERPISGIDIQLMSLCAIPVAASTSDSNSSLGSLHLAFNLPEGLEIEPQSLDIKIEGPRDYLLDRVKGDFQADFNVFSWNSEVVDGLGITLEDLEPRVSFLGDLYIPSYLSQGTLPRMPEIDFYRVLLETNIDGKLKHTVRALGQLVGQGENAVAAQIPVEIIIPANSTSHCLDLYVILEYETDDSVRSVRSCFKIQPAIRPLAEAGE